MIVSFGFSSINNIDLDPRRGVPRRAVFINTTTRPVTFISVFNYTEIYMTFGMDIWPLSGRVVSLSCASAGLFPVD